MCDCYDYEDQPTYYDTYIYWVRVCKKCGRIIREWTEPRID